MGLPRYENIDQLPNIAMAVKTQVEYIVQQTVLVVPDEEALAELQAIIEYLLYLLGLYQPQLLPMGLLAFDMTPYIIITTGTAIGPTL